jgi:hypothetical protein
MVQQCKSNRHTSILRPAYVYFDLPCGIKACIVLETSFARVNCSRVFFGSVVVVYDRVHQTCFDEKASRGREKCPVIQLGLSDAQNDRYMSKLRAMKQQNDRQ